MLLVSIFAAVYIIGYVESMPTSTYQRRDLRLAEHPELFLFNQVQGLEDADLFDADVGRGVGGARIKRIGSLSIVNPLDVLRERVLLELARRKMLQNQRQIDINRQFLNSIGKRAITNTAQLGMDSNEDPDPTSLTSSRANDYVYAYPVPENDVHVGGRLAQDQQLSSDRGTERHQTWESHREGPTAQGAENDQTRRMANELNLL